MTTETYWFPEDKDWVAERKRQWRQIKFNLDVLSAYYPPFKRKFHKDHQTLFFYGKVKPDNTPGDDEGIGCGDETHIYMFPIFKIWYHPEPETLNFKQILSESLVGSADINSVRRFFFHEFCLGNAPAIKMYPSDYGMMGGREALCVDFLFPGFDYKESFLDVAGNKHPASMYPHMVRDVCQRDTCRELFMDASFSPYGPGQYLWDHLSYALENYYEITFYYKNNEKIIERIRNDFLTVLAEILSFEQRTDPSRHRPSTIAMVERLLSQYEKKTFSDEMLRLWDEAKKNIKKLKQEQAIKFREEPERLSEITNGRFSIELQEERIAQWKQV